MPGLSWTAALGLWVLMVAGAFVTASAQDCASLSRLQCATSPDCMSIKAKGETGSKYLCIPAKRSCQAGFRQMQVSDVNGHATLDKSYDPAAACKSKSGCKFVPAGECYCPPLANIECYCVGGTPPSCVMADD